MTTRTIKMSDEQNLAYVNDPERVSAEKEVRKIVAAIQSSVRSDGSAEYYLTILPMYVKRLEYAVTNLNEVSAKVELRVLGLIE